MAFNVFGNGLVWPDSLKAATLTSADKKNQCGDIVASLKDAEKACIKAGNSLPFPPKKADHGKASDWVVSAQRFAASSDLKKVAGALKVIQVRINNLLQANADKKNKSVSLDKKMVPILNAISKTAGEYADSLDRKKVLPQIGAIGREAMEAERAHAIKMIGTISSAMKQCKQRGHPGVKAAAAALRDWSDEDEEAQKAVRATVGNAIRDDCRDMTQNISNLLRSLKNGGVVPGLEPRDITTLPKLAKTLVPYAGSQNGTDFTGGKSKAELAKIVKTIKANAQLFDQISDHLP